MKRLFAVFGCLLALGFGYSPPSASASTRRGEIVPLSPSLRVCGVPGAEPSEAVLNFEVTGAPGDGFSLLFVVRLPDGSLLLHPVTLEPYVAFAAGFVVPASGVWTTSVPVVDLSLAVEDCTIEGVALPADPTVTGNVLSWKSTLRELNLGPNEPAPPAFQSGTVEVPGLIGLFPTTTVVVPDNSESQRFHLAENGPGGVYPIG